MHYKVPHNYTIIEMFMKCDLFLLVFKFDSNIVTAALEIACSNTFYFPPKSEGRSRDYKSGQT